MESVLDPADGITDLSSRDWQGDTLPPYAAGLGFVLPADISMQYHVTLNLFSLEGANKRKLSSIFLKVTTYEEYTDLVDVQEGKKLECVERPLLKTKPKGTSGCGHTYMHTDRIHTCTLIIHIQYK